jgi:hypothetical protein
MTSAIKQLQNLEDAMIEDILSLSDGEILAEVREDGEDPAEIAGAMTRIFEAVVEQCHRLSGEYSR